MQQSSTSFAFGQQPGGFSASSNPAGSTPSFPSFGAQDDNSTPQFSGATGFNPPALPAFTGNNPFASSNQNSTPPTASSGFNGMLFKLPPQTPAAPKSPPKDIEHRTPSHYQRNLPESGMERDMSTLFDPRARWGLPDSTQQGLSQQAVTESNTKVTSQQSLQSPSPSIFAQPGQQTQPSHTTFGNLSQAPSSISSPFAQQPAEKPQTPSIFGQDPNPLFQSHSNQPTSNIFGHLGSSQNQAPTSTFGKPATSPTRDGDSMSTTPDTSPQASNDRARLGPFASITAPPEETFINGDTPAGPPHNIFGSSFQPSPDQSATLTNGQAQKGLALDEGSQGNNTQTTDVSLGSPTKKRRSIDHPRSDPSHAEVDVPPKKNPFANMTFPPPNDSIPSTFSFSQPSAPTHKPSSASPQVDGKTTSLFAKPPTESASSQRFQSPRQSGMPPQPPADFTEEQKRQLITGWRLKSLDQGLRGFVQYSTFGKEETESVKQFYELRRQAILEANGGPLLEVRNKRAAGDRQSRTGLRSTTAGREQQHAKLPSARKTSPGKRKANDDLPESDKGSLGASKRSKADDQITYPALPSTAASSQTSKMFGNLVGKKGPEASSDNSRPAVNGHSPTKPASSHPSPPAEPTSSQSDLFPKPSASASTAPSSGNNSKQTFFFGLGKEPDPKSSRSEPQQPSGPSQVSSMQGSTPFKGFIPDPPKTATDRAPSNGFFRSQTNNGNGATTASGGSSSATPRLGTAQPSSTSSIFSGLSGGADGKNNTKRKADESGGDEGDAAETSQLHSEEQPSKKQKAEQDLRGTSDSDKENNGISNQPASTSRPGFGESIFARSSSPAVSTTNLFGHLAQSSEPTVVNLPDYEDDEDEDGGKSGKGTEQTNAHSTANQTLKSSSSNRSESPPVYNPFASATFGAPSKPSTEAAKPAGRSLFDRVEKDDQGNLVRDATTVNFGQSVLKTPAGHKAGSFFDQAKMPSGNTFGTASSNLGSGTFGDKSPFAAKETPSTSPNSSIFGKPSESNNAPVANMFGAKDHGNSPSGDNTWKPQTPIKFGDSTGASVPSVNFTSPSPAKTPFTGLFGTPKASTSAESTSPFNYKPAEPTSAKPAPLTFGISAPKKDLNDSLAPPSGTQSESTSRATSPGGTDTEGGNEPSDNLRNEESTLHLDSAEASKAEADEDVVFDAKARLYKFEGSGPSKPTWVLKGTEQFRVLKHRETNKTRMLMRLKNGRVILNAGLQISLSYEHAGPKKVKTPVPSNGKVEAWQVMVGKDEDAKKLTAVLEENKAY
ncbi:MAG: hypothetical protein LQ346_000134 [Caloplaca aetnensis]|nr:MAG: hypothetical protein LQ346_000134 [Caloplaca aetnensis]